MTCHRCGKCCENQPQPPWGPADTEWWCALPAMLRAEIRGSAHHDDDPCLWLDLKTRTCLHYEHRPPICRSDPDGEACIYERSKADA